jgi:hypothetical protein
MTQMTRNGTNRRCLLIGQTLIAAALLLAATAGSAELLFHDDFSTADVSRYNDRFRWGTGNVPSTGAGADTFDRIAGPNGKTVNARRFRYGTWQEQRFHLTQSATESRTPNGPSNVAYPEIWVSYWMRVPANYYHRSSGGSAGHNNKGWLYLWKDAYEYWTNSYSDDQVTPTSMSLHWWPTDPTGTSRVTVVASRYRENWGNRSNMTYVAPERQIPGAPSRSFNFLESEYGQWVHFTFGLRVASSETANDGFARIYVNGTLAMAMEGLNSGANPGKNGFDRGYIMGYHNSGYAETTAYYITDFKIGTTAEAVGLNGVPRRPVPNPPRIDRVD